MPTRFAPQTEITASVTSSINRARFSIVPPYSSVRVVGAVLQELVEQVAVCAVHLDAVKAGQLRILCATPVSLDDARNLGLVERARGLELGHRTHQAHVAGGLQGARPDRRLAVEEAWVRDAAHVPDLGEDAAACSAERRGAATRAPRRRDSKAGSNAMGWKEGIPSAARGAGMAGAAAGASTWRNSGCSKPSAFAGKREP